MNFPLRSTITNLKGLKKGKKKTDSDKKRTAIHFSKSSTFYSKIKNYDKLKQLTEEVNEFAYLLIDKGNLFDSVFGSSYYLNLIKTIEEQIEHHSNLKQNLMLIEILENNLMRVKSYENSRKK